MALPLNKPGEGEERMPTKTKSEGRDVYRPIEGFIADVDGSPVNFTRQTYVREGHWILDKWPHLFEPIRVQYDVEQATAAPGEQRER